MVSYTVEVCRQDFREYVLILIVMDNGLLLRRSGGEQVLERCLNPYCNG